MVPGCCGWQPETPYSSQCLVSLRSDRTRTQTRSHSKYCPAGANPGPDFPFSRRDLCRLTLAQHLLRSTPASRTTPASPWVAFACTYIGARARRGHRNLSQPWISPTSYSVTSCRRSTMYEGCSTFTGEAQDPRPRCRPSSVLVFYPPHRSQLSGTELRLPRDGALLSVGMNHGHNEALGTLHDDRERGFHRRMFFECGTSGW